MKRAFVLLAAIVLVVISVLILSASHTKATVHQPAVKTAAQHQASAKTPATGAATASSPTVTPTTAATPEAVASTAAPTPSAAVAPKNSVAPVSPKPVTVPITYVQPQLDTVAQSASISLGQAGCSAGHYMYAYSYSVDFNQSNRGGSIVTEWEVEQASNAVPGLVGQPYLTPVPFGAGVVRVSDTISYWNGLSAYTQTAYRLRMHVTSPGSVYSNWITVPANTASC